MSQQTVEQLVADGVAALRAGERERARQLLGQAVRADPRSPQAWLYLAGAVTDQAQRRQCLERVLSLSPGHPAALRGLASLGAAPAPAPPPAPAAAGPALTRVLPTPAPALTLPPAAPALTLPPAAPALPSGWPAPDAVAEPAPAGGSLLGRLRPGAVTQTTSVAPDPDALVAAPAGPAVGVTTPLLTLPMEPPAPPVASDRRLWLALLALGVVLMLVGLGMAVVSLAM